MDGFGFQGIKLAPCDCFLHYPKFQIIQIPLIRLLILMHVDQSHGVVHLVDFPLQLIQQLRLLLKLLLYPDIQPAYLVVDLLYLSVLLIEVLIMLLYLPEIESYLLYILSKLIRPHLQLHTQAGHGREVLGTLSFHGLQRIANILEREVFWQLPGLRLFSFLRVNSVASSNLFSCVGHSFMYELL